MMVPLINPYRRRNGKTADFLKRAAVAGAKLSYRGAKAGARLLKRGAKAGAKRVIRSKRFQSLREQLYQATKANPCGGRRRNPYDAYGQKYPRFVKGEVPGSVVIKGSDLLSYNYFRGKGYKTLWSGEGKIALKRPATRRGTSHSQQEGSMVYSLKKRRVRRTRRARRNPPYISGATYSRIMGKGTKRRKHSRRHVRVGGKNLGWHRPLLHKTRRGWKRPRGSKLFRHRTLINPRRRRYARRNPFLPKLPFALDQVLVGGVKIAAGVGIGMLGMPIIVKYIAPHIDKESKYRKFYGLVHVVAGAVAASMVKKPLVRDIALTVAGVGVYDLIASNLPIGLPPLADTSDMFKGEDEPGVIGMDADYAPALGSSYQAMGASYGTDDIAYGDDNDSLEC